MDTPSRFQTVDLACSCGASLKHVDFAHRTSEAEGEFRAQHVGEFHVVSEVCEGCRNCADSPIMFGFWAEPPCDGTGRRTKKGED